MMTGRIVDSYTNIATVKLFSHAGREEIYAKEGMDEFLQTVHKQMRKVTLFHIFVYVNNCVALFVISGLSIWFWLNGSISAGAIAIAIGLAMRVNGMSQWIMWEVSALFENIGTVYDGMEMMSKQHDIVDKPDAPTLTAKKGAIHYDRIRFHYGKSKGVIDNLSLDIKAGEKVGLVGRSGAGKTTLMNLLLRFYDLEAGRITIDGQDIAGVSQESLRSLIGVVTQDTSLLHRSIRDNIAYGRPEATDDEVIEAAKRANAWEFIEGLVDMQGRAGLDAQVGERGVKLSGGQRQRVAIARVFLKDAPILVLDEATSALDFGSRGGDPGKPLRLDGGQDGDRHRPPAVDADGDGPADRARQGPDHRGRLAQRTDRKQAASMPTSGTASPAASSPITPTKRKWRRNKMK